MYATKKDIPLICKGCGESYLVTEKVAAKSRLNGHLCYPCHLKSKDEVQMAILNMAVRKYRKKNG